MSGSHQKRKIWILNHYATNMYFDGAGRHHSFAKYLIRDGHEVKIFCSNIGHNNSGDIEINEGISKTYIGNDNVPYTFIKTSQYKGNGISRIRNMICYFKNVKKVCDTLILNGEVPDVIMASSVHPLTLVAGIKIGKKFKLPCVCEIRDIWPLTLVAFNKLRKNSLLHKILLKLELWTYKNADKVIFTMEGGYEYIKDMRWDKYIPEEKVGYINNGVDLELFNENKSKYPYKDKYLGTGNKTFVYTGSIGQANKVERILEVAKECKENSLSEIKFLVFGDGNKRAEIEKEAKKNKLDNIIFKGCMDKKYIPSIVSQSYCNLIFIEHLEMYKYGMSTNKSFDYLAAGRPIILDYEFGYNYILKGNCGIYNGNIYESIKDIVDMDIVRYETMCHNAIAVSKGFDFKVLSNKLIRIFEDVM